MSNEINTTINVQVTNGNFTFPKTGGILQHDQTTAGGGLPGYVVTSTTETTVDTSSLTSEGFVYIKNLDDTDSIEYGPDSGGSVVSFGLVKPGEEHLFRLKPAVTFKVIAQANTPAAMIFVFEA